MRYLIARSSWKWTLLPCALLALAGCGTQQPVYRDREVKVPVPVHAKLDPRLIADCPPDAAVPADGPLPVRAALDRGEAVEAALAQCRGQLAELRKINSQED